MRFLTLNVNGLWDANKRMAFLQWLSNLSVDFACLQETHVLSDDECSPGSLLMVSRPFAPRVLSILAVPLLSSVQSIPWSTLGKMTLAGF